MNRNTIKRQSVLAVLTVAALTAAGCSTESSSDGDTTAATSDGDTTTAPSTDDSMTDDTKTDDTMTDDSMTDDSMTDDTMTDSSSAPGDVEMGPGVTEDSINVAIMTDLSGPFAAGAAIQVDGFNAYWDQVNSDGGVCGRTVNIDVQDHGYDPQTATTQYQSIADDTLAIQQMLGSPVVAALLPDLEKDNMYVGGMGWPSVVLPAKVAQLPGASYSIEGANAVDYLVEKGMIAEGDAIGVIFFEGDFGGDVAAGADFAAEQHGLTTVEQPVTPQDSDLTAQVAALQQGDVKAVVIGGSPGTLGSYAGAALTAGLEVPVIGANPVFNPSLLDSPAADFLTKNYISITSVSPFASTEPGPTEAAKLYTDAGGEFQGWEVPLAYGQAVLLHDALNTACDAGALTREGVVDGMRSATGLNTDGVFPDGLDYTTVGESPTRKVFVATVDAASPGGLTAGEVYEGPSATAYSFG